MRRPLALLASVSLLASVVMVGAATASADAAPRSVSARSLLSKIAVRAEDHSRKYNRDRFNYDHDYDADGDGCYTRREVLKRDAIHIDRISKSRAIYGGRWKSL